MSLLFPRRMLMGTALLIGLILPLGEVPISKAQDSNQVLDQKLIEIDGMRPIGLSPDGNWLAATDFATDELCVYDVESLDVRACASMEPLVASLRIEDVTWSPDSTRLALAERTFVLFKDGDIWVMDAATGELTDVTDDGYVGSYLLEPSDPAVSYSFDISPAWAPDGSSLTYSRSPWSAGAFQGNDIALVPAGGGQPVSLAMVDPELPGIAYYGMEWTQDWQSLYYSVHSVDDDDPGNGIYRYDRVDGSTRQVLPLQDEEMGAPAVLQVSPAGTHLLVWYPHVAGSFARSEPLYWLYEVDSGALTALEPPENADPGIGWVSGVCFSPDGKSLLTATRNTNPDNQLWVTDIATGSATQLVESLPGAIVMDYGLPLSWTASGRIFVPANIGSGTLLTVDSR